MLLNAVLIQGKAKVFDSVTGRAIGFERCLEEALPGIDIIRRSCRGFIGRSTANYLRDSDASALSE